MADAINKRSHSRTEYNESLKFSVSVVEFKRLQKVNATGTGFNISKQGMGFYTEFPLEPGHILRIEKKDALIQTAMVKWVQRIDSRFRVGVFLYN